MRYSRLKNLGAVLTAMILLLPLFCFLISAQAADLKWPFTIIGREGTLVIYQPQPEKFTEDQLSLRSAVALIPDGVEEPVFGAAWYKARLSTDRDKRLATIEDIEVTRVMFPDTTPEEEKKLIGLLNKNFPKTHMNISLDRLMTTLELAERERLAAESLETAPPRIIFTTVPSVLITIDGRPELQPVKDSPIMRVVNTPFIILFDTKSRTYFLKGGPAFFSAADYMGPWKMIDEPPASILEVMPDEPEQKQETAAGRPPDLSKPPRIIVATEPTELIFTDGPPKYTHLVGTELMFIHNTDSDVFFNIDSKKYYILLSGRWYESESLEEGPWSFVPADRLPASLARIGPDSVKGHVLASVAGTEQAKDAVLDASIPQTAVIKRDRADLKATYDGKPRFESIKGTSLKYAVNTPDSIILSGSRYYACHEGVWYVSDSPDGPWSVATSVPEEIYAIPPSSPVYNVKYVYIYDYTPEVVYVGYLPGYMGTYVYGPTVVFGTGYRYRGWYNRYYYPWPCTWGFHARYNPWAGWWGFGFCFSFCGIWYHPAIPGGGWFFPGYGPGFDWGRGPGAAGGNWWGPGGWRGKTGFKTANRNIYNRIDNIKRNARPSRDKTPQRIQTAKPDENNVFIDRKGNIYRRTKDGWQKHSPQGWGRPKSVKTPTRIVKKKSPDSSAPDRLTRPDKRQSKYKTGSQPSAKTGKSEIRKFSPARMPEAIRPSTSIRQKKPSVNSGTIKSESGHPIQIQKPSGSIQIYTIRLGSSSNLTRRTATGLYTLERHYQVRQRGAQRSTNYQYRQSPVSGSGFSGGSSRLPLRGSQR